MKKMIEGKLVVTSIAYEGVWASVGGDDLIDWIESQLPLVDEDDGYDRTATYGRVRVTVELID